MDKLINLFDFEKLAQSKLAKGPRAYYSGGAGDEITLRDNHDAYSKIKLIPRVFRDVSSIDTSVNFFDEKFKSPIFIAPSAFQKLATPDAECATAQAANHAKTIMTLSSISNMPMEDVKAQTQFPLWFQLYINKDRGATEKVLRRAEAVGVEAIVITVDAPVWGLRERDKYDDFVIPKNFTMPNFAGDPSAFKDLGEFVRETLDPALTWDDIAWVKSQTKLKVLVKGVQHPKDAELAVKNGADGIVVSNHGGRQLDTVLATIDMLPEIRKAVGKDYPLIIDGGIRRGTDIVKAIALGADAVQLGRPILWGLTCAGHEGASQVLDIINNEFENAMALCGFRNVQELKQEGLDVIVRG